MKLYELDSAHIQAIRDKNEKRRNLKAKADEEFEQILFGDLKNSDEEDTRIEAELYSAVSNFIHSPGGMTKDDAHKALNYLKQFTNVYPNDLEPNATTVYRGTKVPVSKFLNILFKNDEQINIDDSGHLTMPYVYKAMSPIQSWTTDLSTSDTFSNTEGKYVPAIFIAKVDDSFIMNTDLTNQISQQRHNHSEYEIIRISDEPLECQLLVKLKFPPNIVSILKKHKDEAANMIATMINLHSFRKIVNPSEILQLFAVQLNGFMIRYIENPSEKVQLAAIKNSKIAIQNINNPTEKAFNYHKELWE